MKAYKNLGGNSGIMAYEYNDRQINVQFSDRMVYEYHADRIGAGNLVRMKQLADAGKGLNSYITRNSVVKNGFSKKYRLI